MSVISGESQTVLLEAGKSEELLELAQKFPEPKAIKDPVRRREVQLHRLKMAMRVAKKTGKRTQAILVLLRGAKALKTDAAVQKMLTDNIDLAVVFAQPSLRRIVLSSSSYVGLQGSVLSNLMAESARKGDGIRTRDWGRQFRAWLPIYFDHSEKKGSAHRWTLSWREIAAEGEARLRTAGVAHGIEALYRWKPRGLMPRAVLAISNRMIASGSFGLIEEILSYRTSKPLWDVFLRVPLALSGKGVDVDVLDKNIGRWVKWGFLTSELARQDLTAYGDKSGFAHTLLTAAEIVVSRAGLLPGAKLVLEIFASPKWRQSDSLYPSSHEILDASMRAHTLLEFSSGKESNLESYLLSAVVDEAPQDSPAKRKRNEKWIEERLKVLGDFSKSLLPVYNARAKFLLATNGRAPELEQLASTVKSFGKRDYARRNDHDAQAMRQRIAESNAELIHLSEVSALAIAEVVFADEKDGLLFARRLRAAHTCSLHSDLHAFVLAKVVERAKRIRLDREPATHRAEEFINLARLVATISVSDAQSLFAEATAVLDGVDFDSVHQLEMFEYFSTSAALALGNKDRRQIACHLEAVTSEVSGYLGEDERIPWESLARTLSHLDLTVALAAMSRWSDQGVVPMHRMIPEIVRTALLLRATTSACVLPLLYLNSEVDSSVLDSIEARLIEEPAGDRANVIEELARLTVLNIDGDDGVSVVRQVVDLSNPKQSTHWILQARNALRFFEELHVQSPVDFPNSTVTSLDQKTHVVSDEAEVEETQRTISLNPNWSFITEKEIESTIKEVADRSRLSGRYIPASAVMEKIRSVVKLSDRRRHIEALDACSFTSRYDQADAISAAVIEWVDGSLGVEAWCKEQLPDVIVRRLPFLFQHISRWDSGLPELLAASGLKNDEICTAILEGLEYHAERWDSSSVYGLLGLVGRYLPAVESADVLKKQLDEEFSTVSDAVVPMKSEDLPATFEGSIGRTLYAFAGDVDIRLRWASGHGLRAAGRLNLEPIIDAAIRAWDKKSEQAFRDPKAPFYWAAARLWTLVAVARMALEVPALVKVHRSHFLRVVTDNEFPHFLCRHFAKAALTALIQHEPTVLTEDESTIVREVNKPRLLAVDKKPEFRPGFNRFESSTDRKFHFNSSDTLPYWYERALKLFVDVKGEEFLDIAEKWIVERWGAGVDVWKWDKEPRRVAFDQRRHTTSHRQGSMPTVERYSTHLEWHAMWCTVGELLESRRLVKVRNGEYGSLSYWVARWDLTAPPYWLTDLRSLKPLELRFWKTESLEDKKWLEGVDQVNLLDELGISDQQNEVVVCTRFYGREGEHRNWTTTISSALVSPGTASALLRSLQGVKSSWDYGIPDEGDDMEFAHGAFRLQGWLVHSEKDRGLDDDDTLRRDVRGWVVSPGKNVRKALRLKENLNVVPQWGSGSVDVFFRYTTWSDDFGDLALRNSNGFPRSQGYRLTASKEAIHKYLENRSMDLLIEVNTTRSSKRENDDDDDSQDTTEAEYDLVVVLRRDGSIEGAGGRLGTWALPGSTA